MPSEISFTLDETFAAIVDGQTVSFAHRRTERLLAYLALNGPTGRTGAARALWPGVDRERALASLRQALRAVSLEGGEGWIVADRNTLRLDARIAVRKGEGRLLESWDEPWIAMPTTLDNAEPPFDALFRLVAWYRDRSPETALGMIAEAHAVLAAAPVARVVREIAPFLARLARLPEDSVATCHSVARAYYLMGEMEKAYAIYGRIATELSGPGHLETAACARLSQVVILRESGAPVAAARLAGEIATNRPDTPTLQWTPRYHLGLALHMGGDREGLRTARMAVESSRFSDSDAITRLFPILNVAEGLIDAGDPAAYAFLREGARLAVVTGDSLGRLTADMLEALLVARESPEHAFEALRTLERQAWEARFVPFATSVADRTAGLAHRLGRLDEAKRRLRRNDRVRKRLGLRRAPIESARIVPVPAAS